MLGTINACIINTRAREKLTYVTVREAISSRNIVKLPVSET